MLKVKNLSTYYFYEDKTVKAVDGVSLNVEKGEFVFLVGESGCGKTTLGLSIIRLIEPPGKIVSGSIVWKDKDILKMSEGELKKIRGKEIGIIFQDVSNALNPVIKVGEQVAEVFETHLGFDKRKARIKTLELFEFVGIGEPERIFYSYPHQLSGGLKQRVLVSMAFASKPELVIADEPTSYVDAVTQKQIIELFKFFNREFKTAILFITHNLGIVAELGGRVYVMCSGKIVEYGRHAEILNSPKNKFTQKLVSSAKFLSL